MLILFLVVGENNHVYIFIIIFFFFTRLIVEVWIYTGPVSQKHLEVEMIVKSVL